MMFSTPAAYTCLVNPDLLKSEVHYSEVYTHKDEEFIAITLTTAQYYAWTCSVGNHFRVTGDSTPPGWPWRTKFADLCNNNWVHSEDFAYSFTAPATITNYEKYYTDIGENAFAPGGYSSSAIRSLDERVTDYFHYTIGY